MNFSTGCDDAVREAITQSGINNGASTHICVRKTDQDEEIWIKLINLAYAFAYNIKFYDSYCMKWSLQKILPLKKVLYRRKWFFIGIVSEIAVGV